jgi:hypothetical protein
MSSYEDEAQSPDLGASSFKDRLPRLSPGTHFPNQKMKKIHLNHYAQKKSRNYPCPQAEWTTQLQQCSVPERAMIPELMRMKHQFLQIANKILLPSKSVPFNPLSDFGGEVVCICFAHAHEYKIPLLSTYPSNLSLEHYLNAHDDHDELYLNFSLQINIFSILYGIFLHAFHAGISPFTFRNLRRGSLGSAGKLWKLRRPQSHMILDGHILQLRFKPLVPILQDCIATGPMNCATFQPPASGQAP